MVTSQFPFLSRLYGGEHHFCRNPSLYIFLSRLYGGELCPALPADPADVSKPPVRR
ncbi:hypothetical protein D1BOALGB6SA_9714 [Olavius sp. associated proteobacterium Delta 1]|nr:hypothetical protein D1BOALGB6SA_9714 [Olavius sp. associated proteobacterium Delta 1]